MAGKSWDTLYIDICQRNMQKKTVDIIRLIICYTIAAIAYNRQNVSK